MDHLPGLLARILEQRGISQRKLAELLGVSPSTITNCLAGTYAPYWKRAEPWADALGLSGPERERFLDAMAVAAAPDRVAAIIARLEQRQAT